MRGRAFFHVYLNSQCLEPFGLMRIKRPATAPSEMSRFPLPG